jgi:hypothetical protein
MVDIILLERFSMPNFSTSIWFGDELVSFDN